MPIASDAVNSLDGRYALYVTVGVIVAILFIYVLALTAKIISAVKARKQKCRAELSSDGKENQSD